MELTRRLILSRINGNNGKVLIPFAGSGSECVVAQTLGIEFLGIEINPEFSDFAEKWIEYEREHSPKMLLFGDIKQLDSNEI